MGQDSTTARNEAIRNLAMINNFMDAIRENVDYRVEIVVSERILDQAPLRQDINTRHLERFLELLIRKKCIVIVNNWRKDFERKTADIMPMLQYAPRETEIITAREINHLTVKETLLRYLKYYFYITDRR